MKSVSRIPELLTRLSHENNFQKMKIKSLVEEIKNLMSENTTLRENILPQIKIIENLSGINKKSNKDSNER